jgi:hypothetical protein
MCKLQTYLLQIQFPSSQLIVVLRCVFIDVDCCLINHQWLWGAPAQSNCLSSLFTSFFSSMSIFDPVDCNVPSFFHRLDYQPNQIEVERGGWLLHLPAQSPITSCIKAHHLQWSSSALEPQPRLFVDPSIISTAAALTEAKGMCFGSDLTTNCRGWEVELK